MSGKHDEFTNTERVDATGRPEKDAVNIAVYVPLINAGDTPNAVVSLKTKSGN